MIKHEAQGQLVDEYLFHQGMQQAFDTLYRLSARMQRTARQSREPKSM
jgi:hypothetical protein